MNNEKNLAAQEKETGSLSTLSEQEFRTAFTHYQCLEKEVWNVKTGLEAIMRIASRLKPFKAFATDIESISEIGKSLAQVEALEATIDKTKTALIHETNARYTKRE
jgi:hypothetical protein